MSEEKIFNNLTYSMKKKTSEIISLKEKYDNYRIIDINIAVAFIIITISVASLVYQFNTNPYILKNYIFPLFLFAGSSGYLYYYYIRKQEQKEIIRDAYNKLRLDMILNIDNQFLFEFCNHNQKCKCKELYIKYMNSKYNIDLIFK
jgi:hypothetical protein